MICNLCPRKCSAVRTEHSGSGFCQMGTLPVVARIAPHYGEEPCISGTNGSGTVFFSGCTMKCKFCQNHEISLTGKGTALTPEQLAEGYRMLEQSGVHNINLVTADHFVEAVVKSLEIYRPKLPIVYNCSGYTAPKTLSMLDGLVDIYLPDFKYADDSLAKKLSHAPDYSATALAAIKEMIFQVGTPEFDADGLMKKGVIVRHLILPGCTVDSCKVLDFISERLPKGTPVSLMRQYTPSPFCKISGLDRRITEKEYNRVRDHMLALDLPGFLQEPDSADRDFIPLFNQDESFV